MISSTPERPSAGHVHRAEWQVRLGVSRSGRKGEISDAVLLSNGNVLFAHQFGVTLIDREKKVLWSYDAPPGTEVHTAQPIVRTSVLYVQNGDPAKVAVVNIVTGKIEREFVVPVRTRKAYTAISDTPGDRRRHAAGRAHGHRKGSNMTPRASHSGRTRWGRHLVGRAFEERQHPDRRSETGARGGPRRSTVWEFSPADVPDYLFNSMQIAKRLPNGNTLINTWFNQWNGPADPGTAPVQALEVTPDKKIVWALRAWGDPVNLGPSTTIQLLDEPSVPEAVHFGDLGR